jgi:hypothetical protein
MRVLGATVTLLSYLLGSALSGPATAEPLIGSPAQGALCRGAIAAAERSSTIPPQLLAAIGMVESGRRDPANGLRAPWPWTINAEGQGSYFDTKAQAIAAVRALQAHGVQSIDVGCMQVNLMHHPNAFATLEQAFDPSANAAYAARFLTELHTQSNDWPRAAGLYHSATPELGAAYQAQVASAWTEERRLAGAGPLGIGAALPSAGGAGGAGAGGISPMGGVPYHGGMAATLPHGAVPVGRALSAYRSAPVQYAARGPGLLRRN